MPGSQKNSSVDEVEHGETREVTFEGGSVKKYGHAIVCCLCMPKRHSKSLESNLPK